MKESMKAFNEKAARTWVLVLTSVGSFMVALDAMVVRPPEHDPLTSGRLNRGVGVDGERYI